ncbi:hypothetical protein C8Q74DRAFT_1007711 [Fomes fomentarius]|nr:hypothetical protein C8Q74DRAFT_1007711 [Fomes fomentarius]
MNRSRLCIDTCEHIIDLCCSERSLLRTASYPILCQTALVCLRWRHRSLFNLYHEVVLEHVLDLDLLLRTLREKPSLAKLVRSLTVVSGRYIPFARTPLPRLLSHGIALNLDAVLYWSNYPPHYVETHLRDFSASMVELRIAIPYRTRPPRFVCGLTAQSHQYYLPMAATTADAWCVAETAISGIEARHYSDQLPTVCFRGCYRTSGIERVVFRTFRRTSGVYSELPTVENSQLCL